MYELNPSMPVTSPHMFGIPDIVTDSEYQGFSAAVRKYYRRVKGDDGSLDYYFNRPDINNEGSAIDANKLVKRVFEDEDRPDFGDAGIDEDFKFDDEVL